MKYNRRLPKSINRRDFLKLTGLTGGAAALAACGTQESATEAPKPEEGDGEEPSEPVEMEKIALTFWTPGGSDQYCEGFQVIGQNYMAENPNIIMNETQCNPTGENYDEVLLANIAAGTPPDATIVWNSPVSYAVRGALEELDGVMGTSKNAGLENWPEGVLGSCQYKGKTYGLPAAAAPYAMYYNVGLFEEKGIPTGRDDFPKTWDELRALSKEFTEWEGDLLKRAGFFPFGPPSDFYGMAVEFVIWAHTNGSGVFDTENLKKVSTDGRISNESVKAAVIARVIELTALNNRILYVNSPEFSYLFSYDEYSVKTIQLYRQQTVDSINEQKSKMEITILILDEYQKCIEKTRDFVNC